MHSDSEVFKITMRMVEHHSPGCPHFGIAPVTVTIGGSPVEGVAMVVRTQAGVIARHITSTWEHAEKWYREHGATKGDLENLLEALEANEA